jgi:tetratricopeptide (TPR) repeat protein
LLLVFEDLHWIDSETQALLDSLVESLPTARILLLVNFRPEYRHEWGSRGYYIQVRVDPLGTDGAGELLDGLLGTDAALEPLRAILTERTEGNPFFLEESVRSLVESGQLVGERGAYRPAGPVTGVRMPATVQAVLASRIDRLPPDAKDLLQTTSVIGKDVPDALLRAVAERDEDALRRGLAVLQAAEFLYEASLFPEPEYTFKHALTHEVVYGSLLQDRRKALHGRVLDAIERRYADRLAEQTERLAHHAFRAERWEQALRYCRAAGTRAAARSANREAVASYEQALAALARLPEGAHRLELGVDIRLELRSALAALSDHERALECLGHAETLAEALGDRRRQARIGCQAVLEWLYTGRADRAVEAGDRALVIAEALGDVPLQAVARYRIGHASRWRGDFRRAFDLCAWTVAALEGELRGERLDMLGLPSVEARIVQAHCLTELGQLSHAEGLARDAVRVAETLDDPTGQAAACAALGMVFLQRGDLARAIPAFKRCQRIGHERDYRRYRYRAAVLLGITFALAGRVGESRALIEQAEQQAASVRYLGVYASDIALLGDAYRMAGLPDQARATALLALESARSRQEVGGEAWALRLLGMLAARSEPPQSGEAETRLSEALALAEELGMRPLQARCHLGLGMVLQQIGRRDGARAELTAAVAMLSEMGMTHWLPEAEAALMAVTAEAASADAPT